MDRIIGIATSFMDLPPAFQSGPFVTTPQNFARIQALGIWGYQSIVGWVHLTSQTLEIGVKELPSINSFSKHGELTPQPALRPPAAQYHVW
jgi:hypothetical protein